MFYLDNHEDKDEIVEDTTKALKHLLNSLTFVYQLTEEQAISLIQDLVVTQRNPKI